MFNGVRHQKFRNNKEKLNRNLLRRIWMKLFLCSHFSSVGSLIKEEIDNKKVAFIPSILLATIISGFVNNLGENASNSFLIAT